MEEIDLEEIFSYFKSKLFIIIITLLVALLGCMVYVSYFQKPLYQSYTTVLLTQVDSESTITYSDINLNKNLIDTYSEIIKSKKIANQVITTLNLNYPAETLINKLSVSSVNDTEIIKISVTDADPAVAMTIANEITNVFMKEISNYYNIENIGIIDEAEKSVSPFNINLVKEIIIFSLIGIILGLGIVFVMFYFDTTIKNRKDIEKLGLSVIGEVPEGGSNE